MWSQADETSWEPYSEGILLSNLTLLKKYIKKKPHNILEDTYIMLFLSASYLLVGQYNLAVSKEMLKGQFSPFRTYARKVFSALLHNVSIKKICYNSISKSL